MVGESGEERKPPEKTAGGVITKERRAEKGNAEDTRKWLKNDRWLSFEILGISVSLLVLTIGILIIYASGALRRPEITLSVLLVLGVIALVIALAVVAAVFRSLDLSNERQPLGLPQGSIRAVIALSLILIFMMSSVLLYEEVARPDGSDAARLENITQEQLDQIPVDEILSIKQSVTIGNETRFNVTRLVGRTEASEDLAKQIITTVSTLVVAVAGFYFGSKSVEEATRSARGDGSAKSAPIIRKVEPKVESKDSPVARGTDTELTIEGRNLESVDKVLLVRDGVSIECTNMTKAPTLIRCTVNIPKDTGENTSSEGKWAVVVMESGREADRLNDAVTVSSG